MKQQETPFKCHLLVCTQTRDDMRKSCGDADTADLKGVIKEAIQARGWKGVVRVSKSGCLGACEMGPNIMLYPQEIMFSEVTTDDIPEILQTVGELIKDA